MIRKRFRKIKKKSGPFRFTYIFLAFALLIGAIFALAPKKTFSESENRSLAAFPNPNAASVLDGSWETGVNSWYADHFPFRDSWMSLQLGFRALAGEKESGGVILGDDGWLFLSPDRGADSSDKTEAMERFAALYPDIRHYALIACDSRAVNSRYLPAGYPDVSQTDQLDLIAGALRSVKTVDVTEALRSAPGQVFYRTDHHWTGLGAYTAFGVLAPAMGIKAPDAEPQILTVSRSFEGTLASKSGRHGVTEQIDVYLPSQCPAYRVEYPDGSVAGSVFVPEKLDTRDQYAVYFGGNWSTVSITTAAGTGRRLLVFKDSYANSLVPLLIPYFDRIVMIDPRYCYDDLQLIMNQEDFTDALFLYNLDTFLSDRSLASIIP